jgi:hypothetical protein
MMTIAVCTGFHGRPAIFELFLRNFRQYSLNSNFKFVLCVSGSRDDSESFRVLEESGIRYHFCEIPNEPLGRKMNAAISLSRQISFDYLLSTGFDDLFYPKIFDRYKRYTDEGIDYIGIKDIYFLNFHTGNVIYWPGYTGEREGETVGTGRMFSRRIIEQLEYRLWDDERNMTLDVCLTRRLQGVACTRAMFSCRFTPVVDIKNGENIWSFESLSGEEVEIGFFLKEMGIFI